MQTPKGRYCWDFLSQNFDHVQLSNLFNILKNGREAPQNGSEEDLEIINATLTLIVGIGDFHSQCILLEPLTKIPSVATFGRLLAPGLFPGLKLSQGYFSDLVLCKEADLVKHIIMRKFLRALNLEISDSQVFAVRCCAGYFRSNNNNYVERINVLPPVGEDSIWIYMNAKTMRVTTYVATSSFPDPSSVTNKDDGVESETNLLIFTANNIAAVTLVSNNKHPRGFESKELEIWLQDGNYFAFLFNEAGDSYNILTAEFLSQLLQIQVLSSRVVEVREGENIQLTSPYAVTQHLSGEAEPSCQNLSALELEADPLIVGNESLKIIVVPTVIDTDGPEKNSTPIPVPYNDNKNLCQTDTIQNGEAFHLPDVKTCNNDVLVANAQSHNDVILEHSYVNNSDEAVSLNNSVKEEHKVLSEPLKSNFTASSSCSVCSFSKEKKKVCQGSGNMFLAQDDCCVNTEHPDEEKPKIDVEVVQNPNGIQTRSRTRNSKFAAGETPIKKKRGRRPKLATVSILNHQRFIKEQLQVNSDVLSGETVNVTSNMEKKVDIGIVKSSPEITQPAVSYDLPLLNSSF